MSLARAYLGARLLWPARLLPSLNPKSVMEREGGTVPRGVLGRGIFGKVAGKSQSKVLSSPSDGIAQFEGEVYARV